MDGYKLGKNCRRRRGCNLSIFQIKSQYRKSNYDPKKCLIKIYHKDVVNQQELKTKINDK